MEEWKKLYKMVNRLFEEVKRNGPTIFLPPQVL